jgi:hypothetical protein
MRSEIVFEALHTTNRFALCHLAFKAVRKLHNPGTRIQDTTNDVLQRLASTERQEGSIEAENTNDAAEPEAKPEQFAVKS